jgi:hypothetical protein
MAKMFYTMDETKTALGQTEDQIRQLAKDGRLREFRDGNRLMFKTDQVEQLKGELAAGGDQPIDLSPADAPIGLADAKDSSASGITLADSGGTGMGMASPGASKAGTKAGTRVPSSGGSVAGSNPSDDTALAADLGLSGSVSGIPSSGRAATAGAGASGTRSGIDIFAADEGEKVDPSSQTSIAPGVNADQINIESVGSGSGLLDLTRESDDTSLGAELMDEIAPGAGGARRQAGESSLSASALGGSSLGGSGPGVAMGDMPATPSARSAPAIVEAADPLAPAFGMAAIGAAGVVLFASFALMCGLAGNHPAFLAKLGSTTDGGFGFLIVLALTFALPVILFAGALLSSKMGRK